MILVFLGLSMENLDGKSSDSTQCVRVAVNIRPLITPELMVGCTDCITVVPGEPQVLVVVPLFYACAPAMLRFSSIE